MSDVRNPVTILWDQKFPEISHFYYELGNPYADTMDTNVTYAGVPSYNRRILAENTVGVCLGYFEPPKARWLGGLIYHAILPEPPHPDIAERPDPQQIPLRNQLAAIYSAHMLGEFVRGYVHRPKVTGVEPGWDLGQIYGKLGERRASTPWLGKQREYLAAMLAEPGFNAVLMAWARGLLFSNEDCVDGDETKISMEKFIDSLNRDLNDSRAIAANLYTQQYARIKTEFVRSILAWATGKSNWHIFGRVGDHYQSPEEYS